MLFTRTTSAKGIANPWGTYDIRPTQNGIAFQVSVRDPSNNVLLGVLIAISIALAFLACTGFWTFLFLLVQLLVLGAGLYICLASTKLTTIELRPDGIVVRPKISDEKSEQFFDRRSITNLHLDYDGGLTFRYGIYDIRATPAFASEREFECFEQHFAAALARLWHQSNL
jgi:hypothetical protein